MFKKLVSVLCIFIMLMTMVVTADEANGGNGPDNREYTLDQVVVLSRHNIRSPLSEKGSVLDDLTTHEWFSWTSAPSELSLKGAMLETTMGQYFRLWLEKEGLFPENYLPEDGAVRFYANGLQRTQATAHYFSTGLLPVAVVPVERHVEYNEIDETFVPIVHFMNDAFKQDVLKEVYENGGGEDLAGYRSSLDEAFDLLVDVTDMMDTEAYQSGKYGDFLNDGTTFSVEAGKEPTLSGPIKTACSLADALVLQYYEEPDEQKAAFGQELTEEDWKTIGSVLGTYEDILFGQPLLSVTQAHLMLEEIYSEMNMEGRKFSFLCGHDSTLTSVMNALGVQDYTLPEAIEPKTPIGSKLVFERWTDQDGEAFCKVSLVYQSVDQLRSIQPLSLDTPPMIVPISFEGVEVNADGMIPEKEMMELFEEKIGAYDTLEETYREEQLQEAA